ncbi:DUF6297 family protein [Cellulomonas sp. Root137]|uniref:DUF6297 family protein n=1 Tax=Cellulomonas sp. Root137 TaxID=1736459 RepID=UPI0007010028|nr:DUF6297 family protein [Cellulomonas sp. Root137]KQY47552.1 hypothetical protein ASD18_09620 [Cellulomonas sp. Root137]
MTDTVGTHDDEPAVQPFDLGDVPSAKSIRRFTAQAANARGGANIGDLLSSVYYAVISIAISVGLALGFAQAMRASLPPSPDVEAPLSLSLATLVVVIIVALAGALLSLAGRLGPVGAGGAEAAWWLGLPVDRRGLLRPAARRLPLLAGFVGAVLVALLDAGLLADPGLRVARVAATAALVAAGIVLVAAVGQSASVSRRSIALAGDVLLFLAPVAAVILARVGWSVDEVPGAPWWFVAALVPVVTLLAVVVDRRLGRMPARSLRESGSVATQAVGAVVSMDSRELGRALTDGAAAPVRRWVSRLRTARGPVSALITADVVVLRRSARHVVQLVVAALVPVLVSTVPQLASSVGVLLALLVAGSVAMSATGEGARRAEMAPILDRLLPIDAKTVRRLRMVVPAAAMALWSVVAFAAVGRWASDVPGWIALGLASTPVWAAAAVRASYRPAPDWGGALVSTPMGALPTGVATVLARGPDLVVLCLLPVWIAVLLRTVNATLLYTQIILSVIAVAVASSIRTRSLMETLMDAQEQERAGARR